jgi:predicted amidohydrolase
VQDLDDEIFTKAETLEGPTITKFKELAASLKIYITGGLGEKSGKDFFNTMFFIGPGGLMAIYHKKYVFNVFISVMMSNEPSLLK